MAKVTVKIAVVVNSDGEWGCCGYPVKNQRDLQGMMDLAMDGIGENLGKPEAQFWLTAELDLPTVTTTEAKVGAA